MEKIITVLSMVLIMTACAKTEIKDVGPDRCDECARVYPLGKWYDKCLDVCQTPGKHVYINPSWACNHDDHHGYVALWTLRIVDEDVHSECSPDRPESGCYCPEGYYFRAGHFGEMDITTQNVLWWDLMWFAECVREEENGIPADVIGMDWAYHLQRSDPRDYL